MCGRVLAATSPFVAAAVPAPAPPTAPPSALHPPAVFMHDKFNRATQRADETSMVVVTKTVRVVWWGRACAVGWCLGLLVLDCEQHRAAKHVAALCCVSCSLAPCPPTRSMCMLWARTTAMRSEAAAPQPITSCSKARLGSSSGGCDPPFVCFCCLCAHC